MRELENLLTIKTTSNQSILKPYLFLSINKYTEMKIILKGILLYFTTFITLLFISAIDSIAENGIDKVFICLLFVVTMILLCIINIDKKDLDKLTFNICSNEKD